MNQLENLVQPINIDHGTHHVAYFSGPPGDNICCDGQYGVPL